jgi:hyaluronan synthase
MLAVACAWGFEHAMTAKTVLGGGGTTLGALYVLTFLVLVWQAVLYAIDRPRKAAARHAVAQLRTVVAVPCYNEDPEILQQSLLSMLDQTRRPDHVFVVDDGSNKADYTEVRNDFQARAASVGVKVSWVRTKNGGKRHAHAVAVRGTPEADIYITIDSDGILDPHAIEELLAPFSDRTVQSVAGIVLAANNRGTILARILDLLYLPPQLTNRAGLSVMGSVLVNSGALAAYRADAVREALPVYLGETFFGRPVGFSDDSMLTLLAYLRGRTLQQSSAFVFAHMPEVVSHHARQYLRWMRGSFIRSWWRFRYLPLRSYAYWWHLLGWVLTAVGLWAFTDLYIVDTFEGRFKLSFIIVPVILGYVTTLPYLTVRRSDEPFWSRIFTWLLTPLAVIWTFTVLRMWRWYGALTCRKTGWGTRKKIEVTTETPEHHMHPVTKVVTIMTLVVVAAICTSRVVAPDFGPSLVPPPGRLLVGAADSSASAFATSTGVQPELLEHYIRTNQPFDPSFAGNAEPFIQIAPRNASLAGIAAGHYDGWLTSYAKSVAAFGRPVLLGFAPEMNGTWYTWGYTHVSPADYIAAWRHVVTLFRAAGANNVTWIWTVNVVMAHWNMSAPAMWWPGAAWVGMVGIDGYYYGATQNFSNMFGPVLADVRKLTNKPVLVSESSVAPAAGQPSKITDLFKGASANKLFAVVWFDLQGNQNWQLTQPASISAFRAAVNKYGWDAGSSG